MARAILRRHYWLANRPRDLSPDDVEDYVSTSSIGGGGGKPESGSLAAQGELLDEEQTSRLGFAMQVSVSAWQLAYKADS